MNKLDWSKGVQTRDGREAHVYESVDGKLFGRYLAADGRWYATTWGTDGSYTTASWPLDLVPLPPPPRKLEGWVNVYETVGCWNYANRREADANSGQSRIACLDLSKYGITFTPGEGL